MDASEIPFFVSDLIEAACDVPAVGHDSYVTGEVQEDSSTQELLSRTEIAPPEVGSWWPIGL
ncbi:MULTISPECIES: hypothetical protein [Ensifer]|jgi:hypothetical protein|uniref:hypothetical protein n=1 Tax=Ensifer TaxID=106591 RepID=UPI0004280138|nr:MULTISPECIES: hypothetical protein [Ensifer]KQX02748.1 hypothetical protein ASD01_18630 [Ensifer sp. Root423]MBD9498375.1 hypothetical protein [Ensifer sp. ENS01]MDF8357527.1 hypothetical protein [Ensifer adhaerens]THA60999.1 hypothetical protein E5176_27010 [Ensifer adhaerens]